MKTQRRSSAFDERGVARISLRIKAGALIVAGLFAVLVVRLYSLQIVNGSSLNEVARQTALRDVEVPAMRGQILARGGGPSNVLAGNRAEWVVTLSRQSAQKDPGVVAALAALLPGVTATNIDVALKSNQYAPYQPVPIAQNVSGEAVLYIQEHPSRFPGATAEQEFVRTYPQGSLASQLLGYVGDITAQELQQYQGRGYNAQSQIGQTGLEREYESLLHGTPGIQRVEVNPAGYAVSTASRTPAVPGANLYLNLDLGLERTTAQALASHIAQLRSGPGAVPAKWGAAVVLNAQTGAVLAMASFPSYNNNVWVPYITQKQYTTIENSYGHPFNNYAIDFPQTPGSDFKLATATAALNDGLITPYSIYDDTGSYTIGNKTLYDAPGEVPGPIDVSQAITVSSDVFFYRLGAMFCPHGVGCSTQIQHYAALYGFGKNPAIDLPNVAVGQVDGPQLRIAQHRLAPKLFPNPTYYQGDNVETAFGQGETLITPIQLAEAYGTFANGGTRYAPEVAAGYVTPSGKVTGFKPKVLGHVPLPSATRQAILRGFEGVTHLPTGTGYQAFQGFNFNRWNVAGKTGTATASSLVQPVSWFVGFGGPVGRPMKYVAVAEVDQGGYGASGSAPIVRSIFDYLSTHKVPSVGLPNTRTLPARGSTR